MRPLSCEAKLSLIKRAKAGEKVAKLCRDAGISRKTFYFWLKKYNRSRPNFAPRALQDKRFKTKFTFKVCDPKERLLLINKHLAKEDKVSRLCKEFSISRKTFYVWLKKYQEQGERGLYDRRPCGESHYRTIPVEKKRMVLDFVAQNPDYSVHRLNGKLDFIGHHGIQNILYREDLNTIAKRQLFAQGYIGRPAAEVPTVPEPVFAPWRFRWLFAPFLTIPKWIAKTPFTWPIAFPLLLLFAYIFEIDKFFAPAMFFPTIALVFGLAFFLYSLKYYFSLIIVLAYSGQTQDPQGTEGKGFWNLFRRAFHSKGPKALAIQPEMENIELSRFPFVSVHLPYYNEKRVIERLIRACSSQEWVNPASGQANYELVLTDDSTDETTQIVKKILSSGGRSLQKTFANQDLEVFVSYPQKASGQPRIKLIHRFSRQGFKGAALAKALEQTDERAEFVVVFDADFVPYPDTIEQFVKTFQVLNANKNELETNGNESNIAVVQGYQWHVLNKSENWVTRGVRSEYAGSYVVERAGTELYGGLKMIAGSVFCIRADVLRRFGWGTSITEDLELTLKLYEAGYKVAFTPFIQAPAEAVSTIKRLIRQRMRWAEGHTYNVRKMWGKLFSSPNLTGREKFEFMYLAPYYLQAFFFIVGTMFWFLSEVILKVRLPFWTAAWGWSLVFANFLSLPLVNLVGLFLEESEERDYLGVTSFILLSYVLVPFQAYAAVKALFEREEGPWFRTPKTGRVTDTFGRGNLYEFLKGLKIFGRPNVARLQQSAAAPVPAISHNFSAFNRFAGYVIRPKRVKYIARGAIVILLLTTLSINWLAYSPKEVKAVGTPKLEQQINIIDQTYTTATGQTSYAPTDNSLGLVTYETGRFSNISSVTLQVVIYNSSTDTTTAALCTKADTSCSSPITTLTNNNSTPTFKESADIHTSLSNGTNYTVRIKTSGASTTASIQAARLKILQVGTDGNSISDTQSEVEMGGYGSIAGGSSYADLLNSDFGSPYYCYDSSSTGASTCTAANPSLWSPTPTVYFEATMKSITSNIGYYPRIYCSSSTNCQLAYLENAATYVLHFIQCTAADCSTTSASQSIASDGGGVSEVGFSCISSTDCKVLYSDNQAAGNLKFINCTAADCSTKSSTNTVASGVSAGYHRKDSLYCVATADCKVVFTDNSSGGSNYLRFIQCTAADCSTKAAAQTLDTPASTPFPDIFCVTSSDCKVVYTSGNNLNFIRCTAADCSTKAATQTINTGAAGRPSIYCLTSTDCKVFFENGSTMYFIQCTAADCSTKSAVQTVSTSGNGYLAMFCVSSTDCKTTFFGSTNNLLFVQCTAADCSTKSSQNTVDIGSPITTYARLYDGTNGLGEVSVASANYTLVRSSSFSLTGGTVYRVQQKGSGSIANAKLILYQTAAGGVSGLQTVQQYNNKLLQTTGSYTAQNYFNTFTSGNFTGATMTYYFETTLHSTSGKSSTGIAEAKLSPDPGTSEVTISSTSYTRVRSGTITPTTATNYDVQIASSSTSYTAFIGDSWMIIQVASLPTPEYVLFALPVLLFLPKFMRWIKRRKEIALAEAFP